MASGRNGVVLYEYPFTERVRSLLRLEDLFDRLAFFVEQSHPYCHHAALMALFEILEVTARTDLKGDLLQELDKQRQSLQALRNNPQVAQEALAGVLGDIEQAYQNLNASPGKAGQHLRDNEWLTSIRSRASIPGCTAGSSPWTGSAPHWASFFACCAKARITRYKSHRRGRSSRRCRGAATPCCRSASRPKPVRYRRSAPTATCCGYASRRPTAI
jgi:hypothetical protein